MSTFAKMLGIILLGIVSSILAVVLWESSLFKSWHTGNPIDGTLNWLALRISVRRVILVGLAVWSFASFIYIWISLRRKTVAQLEADYARLAQAHENLQAEKSEVDAKLAKLEQKNIQSSLESVAEHQRQSTRFTPRRLEQ